MATLDCCLSQGDMNGRIGGNLGLLLDRRSFKVREKPGRFEWEDRWQPWNAA